MGSNRFYVRIQGFLLATKAALKKQRCECCYSQTKIIMPAGTTGDFVIPKADWNRSSEAPWPVPAFINASNNNNNTMISWGYNNTENPTQLIIHVGAGTTAVDYHVII